MEESGGVEELGVGKVERGERREERGRAEWVWLSKCIL